MELSQEQRQDVSQWVTEGVGLSDIQKRIKSDFGITMTYIDVRFLVIDLGVDVSPAQFVNAVHSGVDIVALSTLLTTTMPQMKAVVETLAGVGLRDRVKVMVGGAPVTQAFAEEIGADAYGKDAGAATRLAKQFLGMP